MFFFDCQSIIKKQPWTTIQTSKNKGMTFHHLKSKGLEKTLLSQIPGSRTMSHNREFPMDFKNCSILRNGMIIIWNWHQSMSDLTQQFMQCMNLQVTTFLPIMISWLTRISILIIYSEIPQDMYTLTHRIDLIYRFHMFIKCDVMLIKCGVVTCDNM